MSLRRNIRFLTVKEEHKFENNNVVSCNYGGGLESVIFLGIFSEKAASLLNEVINWRINICKTKFARECYGDVNSLKGGGLFVKCNCEVVISSIGEVGLKFKEGCGEYIKKYVRAATGADEMTKAIKDKIANVLKKFWTAHSKYIDRNEIFKIKATDRSGVERIVFEYCETDYRILYEVLKGRNIDKLKAKYDQAKWDEMIGKKVEDQFVLTAIETIQNEIAKITENRDNDLKVVDAEYRQESSRLYNKIKENKERIINDAMEKIKNLQNQISDMMKMGNVMAAGFTF